MPFRRDVGVNILTPIHTIYIARQLVAAFKIAGKAAQITLVKPDSGWGDGSWVVICAQAYDELPATYVAYQLEQSGSSKHFTERYLEKLRGAAVVWDYSRQNIDFLKTQGISEDRLRYVPICFTVEPLPVKFRRCEYDVVFYGDVNNERRKRILDRIGSEFKLKIVSGKYGEALYAELQSARCVVNIHYYEDALFETTRVFECLSRNLCFVSETSRDQDEHRWLEGIVEFAPVDDVERLVEVIKKFSAGGDEYCYMRAKANADILANSNNDLLKKAMDLIDDLSIKTGK